MDRKHFAANNMVPSPVEMGRKCYVSLLAMNKKLRPEDMDTKGTPRYYGGAWDGYGPTIQFSNIAELKGYNAAKDEYKVCLYELTGPRRQRTIWVGSDDVDFANE